VDVVVKFLKKASSNLRAPFSVIVPNHKLPLRERRRMLAKQLAEFVMLYRKVR
jgi:tubulin polyglutamylase TTLL5